MNIENYSFNCKQVGEFSHGFHKIFTYEIFIVDNLNRVTYGTSIQSHTGPPNNNDIFGLFINRENFKHFWIELDILEKTFSVEEKQYETIPGTPTEVPSEPVGNGQSSAGNS
jgi:hypothetical protein